MVLLMILTRFLLPATPEAGGGGSSTPPPFVSQAVTRPTTGGTLAGTLLAPASGPRVPVVLIHPGSGPTDRDGNSPLLPGKNNSLRLLAEGLAAHGIASLRIDKRGIGASAGAAAAEANLRLETYIADAVGWLRWLRDERRFDRIFVLGHSEGALIGAVTAREAGPDGYISLEGTAERGSDVLRRQLRAHLPDPLARASDRVLAALERGERVDSVPPALYSLYRPSVQPYLISWFRYQPTAELGRLTMPVLIVKGTTDLQVGPADADRLHAAQPAARLLRIEGMNHVLKLVGGTLQEQLPSYGDPSLPVAPALVEGVAAFVRAVAADNLTVPPPAP